ncbi:MAG: aldo/keto reductase [Chloroflexi bacterium]|nr:aldo/keto reductase [Chloroflexota bacterium]
MPDLPKRTLGRTGLEVTALGYGTMELRGGPRGRQISEDEAGRILNAVLDGGINFIDTSIDYGIAEERIGNHISHRRDEYYLASKCGCLAGWNESDGRPAGSRGGGPHVFTRENVIAGVEQSLRRLNTDHLDLVQVHGSPSKQELEDGGVVEAMLDLKAQGKVRFIGMSSTGSNLRDHIAMGVFDEFQIPYSCLQRGHEDAIAEAAAAGAGVVVRGGAARGAPSDDERNRSRGAEAVGIWEKADLDGLLGGMSRMEFVVRFTATHPGASTNIVGTLNPEHLAQNIEAVSHGPLPPDLYAAAKHRLKAAGSQPE